MELETSRFGLLEYEEEKVITFSGGMPGFKKYRCFTIVVIEESPFQYLQSVEDGSLAFIIASPFDFFQEYEFDLPDQLKETMNLHSKEQIQVYNIVNVQGELDAATINLAAPIIINTTDLTGMQYILPNGGYSIHQPLFSKRVSAGGE
ncbi:flagellar assembly protein FliW [Paenibacillus sinopodophylli]|uniref:flagellar assembly protein FliW n=1 Tax=Paenibacillus sinopodophylli TaxID=1837342 RepID=UPI00110D02C1|nr:flagellar assembly protein FliW [Paenibacillus sinopodophylli]